MAGKPRKKPKGKKTARRAKRPETAKKPDVRGYIARSLDPEKTGWTEKGHLEGKDALSAVPPEVLEAWGRMMDSGKAKITVKRVKGDPSSFDIRIRETEDDEGTN